MKKIIQNFLCVLILVFIISCNGQELSCKNIESRIENHNINKFIKNTNDQYSYTILGYAIKCGNLDMVSKIIDKGADINLAKSDDIYEYDALFVAIETKEYSIIQYLLNKGANPNHIYNEDGLTPLSLSIINQDINTVKLLIKNKANINGPGDTGGDNIIIPLKEAIDGNNKDIVKLLLESGANVSTLNEEDSLKLSEYNYSLTDQDNILNLKGNYILVTEGEPIGNDNPSNTSYYFSFVKNKAILSIGSDNLNEIYCEGQYSIVNQKKGIFQLKYSDEGICSSDDEINTLMIKVSKQGYYIKGDRFLNKNWMKLEVKN